MIDSHAHVSFSQFNADRSEVMARARQAGVRWVEIGTDVERSRAAVKLASEFPEDAIGATVGVHPSDAAEDIDWLILESLVSHKRVVAVGEVGLDYFHTSRGKQLDVLSRFIQLANERKLPVVFHVRSGTEVDAHEDMLDFLSTMPMAERPRGVMHTFSGTWKQAERYLELGMFISLSGVVTFKNAPDMHEVAQKTPLDRLLIETDCPYLTPAPHRGQRNEPAYVELVARRVAELRGISFEDVAAATEKNTLTLFQ